jgi:hypothetical protein
VGVLQTVRVSVYIFPFMESAAAAPASPTLRDDVREVAWWLLVGAASGAVAGVAVGGVGGRLAMLLLRLTSPDFVLGMPSDDGFEIGVISRDTFQLLLATALLGGVNGVLYAVLRGSIPRRLRLPLWVLFAAAFGGATIVHEDGVDFTLLEPALLAVALFVALPAVAAALVVLLVESWAPARPWSDRRLTSGLAVAAAVGTFALGFAALAGLGALAARRAGLQGLLGRVGRVAVPAALVVVVAITGWELVTESIRIVD